MSMTITNLTNQDYWFGPLHLPAGNGSTLVVDVDSATSLYLVDDAVADGINTLYAASPAKISVSGQPTPFPRATAEPSILHGDGSPDGIVYAGQGSIYLRRDSATLYQKTTGIHLNTGWNLVGGSVGVVTTLPVSPSPGQKVLLRCGSSPYQFVELTYDATYGKWVSGEFSLGGVAPSVSGGSTSASTATQGVGFGTAFSGLSWGPAASGLTLQLKWSGYVNGSGNHLLTYAGIYLHFLKSGAQYATTMSELSGYQDTTTYLSSDFANVSNPGVYDMLNVGVYYRSDNGGSGGVSDAAIVGRWVA